MDLLLKIKGQVGLGEPESAPSTSIWDDMADDFSLSKKQRILGFVMCTAMGTICFFLAVLFAPAIVLVPKKFAFFFTFGNLFLISSTLFLVGPTRQFRSMMEASRLQATVIYFLSLSMTLVSALRFGSTLLVLVFTCMQIMAMVWYCLSYIPFARTLVRRSCRICRLC
eukprot:GGOE01021572.1.p1 GENE.GGOE01021572.1~~GGOE01021572.1.p1  ORF type:complete len:168 (+),score=28.68 GGOE01021572.1:61-564(+)